MAREHYSVGGADRFDGLILSTPTILYTGSERDDPNWFNILHHHAFLEISYVTGGRGELLIEREDTETYPLHKGDLVILNPGVVHEEHSSGDAPLNLVFLAVSGLSLRGLPPDCLLEPGRCPVVSLSRYQWKIESFFRDLITETSEHVPFYQRMSRNLVEALLILILRVLLSSEESSGAPGGEALRIKQYIDRNYTRNLTLDSLSETVYISKSHLSHLFKSQTGMSPIRYLITRRVTEATRLLLETDLPVAEVARRVGYEDPVYFSQLFRRMQGLSPQRLRQKNAPGPPGGAQESEQTIVRETKESR